MYPCGHNLCSDCRDNSQHVTRKNAKAIPWRCIDGYRRIGDPNKKQPKCWGQTLKMDVVCGLCCLPLDHTIPERIASRSQKEEGWDIVDLVTAQAYGGTEDRSVAMACGHPKHYYGCPSDVTPTACRVCAHLENAVASVLADQIDAMTGGSRPPVTVPVPKRVGDSHSDAADEAPDLDDDWEDGELAPGDDDDGFSDPDCTPMSRGIIKSIVPLDQYPSMAGQIPAEWIQKVSNNAKNAGAMELNTFVATSFKMVGEVQ